MKRWSLEPRATGLASVAAAGRPRGYRLRENGETLAYVAYAERSGRWYYYGEVEGRNSLGMNISFDTADEAKVAARTAVEEYLARETNNE